MNKVINKPEDLVIGEDYYLDSFKDEIGTLVEIDDEGMGWFKPKKSWSRYASLDGLIPLPANSVFYETL